MQHENLVHVKNFLTDPLVERALIDIIAQDNFEERLANLAEEKNRNRARCKPIVEMNPVNFDVLQITSKITKKLFDGICKDGKLSRSFIYRFAGVIGRVNNLPLMIDGRCKVACEHDPERTRLNQLREWIEYIPPEEFIIEKDNVRPSHKLLDILNDPPVYGRYFDDLNVYTRLLIEAALTVFTSEAVKQHLNSCYEGLYPNDLEFAALQISNIVNYGNDNGVVDTVIPPDLKLPKI